MPSLQDLRAGKPAFYPDQAIYAEYACAAFGLRFAELDRGTGLVFRLGAGDRSLVLAAGRGSFYPQNTATAGTLAADKYFSSVVLQQAGIATLGGQYFFLHPRNRAHRPPGHERADVLVAFRQLGGAAFLKPLNGSRGDYARAIASERELATYLDGVGGHYDAVLMQPVVSGAEYRIFVLDDAVLYCARKWPPALVGDGRRAVSELLAEHDRTLHDHGLSPAAPAQPHSEEAAIVLPQGARHELSGRMNRSAGGVMTFAAPRMEAAAFALAVQAVRALGLRAGAVDLFTDIDGDPETMAIIEVNANPSIRFLEDSGRGDLILAIWRHGLAEAGLLDV